MLKPLGPGYINATHNRDAHPFVIVFEIKYVQYIKYVPFRTISYCYEFAIIPNRCVFFFKSLWLNYCNLHLFCSPISVSLKLVDCIVLKMVKFCLLLFQFGLKKLFQFGLKKLLSAASYCSKNGWAYSSIVLIKLNSVCAIQLIS